MVLKQTLSLSELCEIHLPFLSPRLISPVFVEKLNAFADCFPPALGIKRFGFEYVLDETSEAVDLGFHVDFNSLLQVAQSFDVMATPLKKQVLWQNLFEMFSQWSKQGAQYEKIDWMCLALDLSSQMTGLPDPNFYLQIKESQQAFPNWDLFKELELFFPIKYRLSPAACVLARCYELSASYRLIIDYIGFMVSRSLNTVRLRILSHQGKNNIQSYLSSLGYSDFLHPLLDKVIPYLGKVALQMDVGEKIGEKIGIEFWSQASSWRELKNEWQAIFSCLFGNSSTIIKEKCEALLAWIGGQKRTDFNSREIHLVRTINHIKIVQEKGEVKCIKVYLTCDVY